MMSMMMEAFKGLAAWLELFQTANRSYQSGVFDGADHCGTCKLAIVILAPYTGHSQEHNFSEFTLQIQFFNN